MIEYHPISSISEGAPIEFDISSSGDDYIDFANSFLHVKVRVKKENDTNLVAADAVGPTNNFLHSLFSQIDVSLNGSLISSSTSTYPYRAYIENLLSYGPAAKKSQLTAALFYKDDADKFDKANPIAATAADKNSGLVKRTEFITLSKEVDLIGRLHSDLFFQSRYMLNEVNTRIKLTRSKDSFCLMGPGADAFKVKITSATMMIRKVKLSSNVYLAHARALESSLAKYPIRRVVCKAFTVPVGNLDSIQEKLFTGQLPSRLIIGCVDTRAFNGTYALNPFNFQHFSMTELSVFLDGQGNGIRPLSLNYTSAQYMNAYMNLFTGTGKANQDEGNDIERTDFDSGYALYVFDLSPDMSENDSFNLVKNGTVRLNMKFGAALAHTISVIVYAEFENIIEIDRNRNIVFDFN
jgi:hypothetical protein